MVNFEASLLNNQKILLVEEEKFKKIVLLILENIIKNKNLLKNSALSEYNLLNKTLIVDVLLTDNDQIKELNSAYRGKNEPTDVLSFALFADGPESDREIFESNEIHLGEVIISVETAKKQAEENQTEFGEEMSFLLCHGVLHLLGFDHPDEKALENILKIQKEILAEIENKFM